MGFTKLYNEFRESVSEKALFNFLIEPFIMSLQVLPTTYNTLAKLS